MEAYSTTPTPPPFQPDTEKIKQYLLKRGVYPTPKFVRNISKKQIQKYNRTLKKGASQTPSSIITPSQKQALVDETHFRNLKREYRRFTRAISAEAGSTYIVGRPWERIERLRSREIASESREFIGEKLKKENLKELRVMFEEDLRWVLDDDIEMLEDNDCYYSNDMGDSVRLQTRQRSEADRIRFLIDRLSQLKVTARDWKLVRMMKQSELRFSEGQLLQILEGLGEKKKWEQSMAVVERVYEKQRAYRSRFVYTKLLAVLGKARRPHEALSIFNLMRGDCNIYPDIAAYHSIAVTLGQAGLLKELVDVIEAMKQRPKRIRNMCLRNWDPVLEPDLVVFNAVLNACVSSHQWKGVSWVFQQLRKSGLKPDGATYGLAMEVMLQSGKYDLVHEYFRKMTEKGEASKAVTYKVLVRAFWEEGKVNEAVEAVREMEKRGVVGTAGVYYELACCLCYSGRWQVAIKEVEKIQKLPHSRPLVVTYTGMIHSSMNGGYVDHCISIFEHMKDHCGPNIGTINAMLKVYGRNDMFSEAKELFEEIKCARDGANALIPDEYTYTQMLEASASASQWEYFDYVYKEMALSGYQLGQSKYARLLVEASGAGKWHILEHAFDAILEDGEIPNQSLFTKMVIQAVAQHNYEKAVSLIGAMAHAPYQFSERQWTDILEGNINIIGPDGFLKLLDALLNCDAQSEITVVNLSRSLQQFCASDTPMDLSSSPAYDGEDIDESSLDFKSGCINDDDDDDDDDDGRVYMPNACLNVIGAKHACGREEGTTQCTNAKACVDNVSSCESHKGSNGEPYECIPNGYLENDDAIEIDPHLTKFDDSEIFSLPSANQILDAWKESRKQDGLFPLQLGQK